MSSLMKRGARQVLGLILNLIFGLFFAYFYYVYVPLVPSFQAVLIPLLLLSFVLTVVRIEWGLLWFVLVYPLCNSLPYFFGVYEHIPHAPVALVVFLAFFWGWMAKKAFSPFPPILPRRIPRPIVFLASIVVISGIIVFWRYTDYYPFLADGIYERIVNVISVRAGGAIMSDVFNSLNYLTGLMFFMILLDAIRTRVFAKRVLHAFLLSIGISLAFSFVQKFAAFSLGNTPGWAHMGQINSTFKDPNAFGAFLSAVLPLLLGITLAFGKKIRVLSVGLIILGLFVFPSIGARSPFLALLISGFLFFVLSLAAQKGVLRKKLAYSLIFLSLMALVIVALSLFFSQTVLSQRLKLGLDILVGKDSPDALFGGKIAHWVVAGQMIKEFPLTGVGMGAYIIELPNYLKSLGMPYEKTDSAENFFFQAGAELGLAGLALFLWIFAIVIKQMRRAWRESRSQAGDRFVLAGIYAGLLSLAVNSLVHSYIGSFDVSYTFWFLAALVFVWSPTAGTDQELPLTRAASRWVPILLIGIFGLVHLWNSTHALSLENRTRRYGWSQNFGLYDQETDERGFAFRWTKKTAGLTIEVLGPTLVLPLKVSHPDLEERPVRARVFLGDINLRRKSLLEEIIIKKGEWQDLEYSLPSPSPKKIYVVLEADRDWNPSKSLGTLDPRSLALGLGEYWFDYPSEVRDKKIKILETYSSQDWQGEFKDNLFTNGISRMPVRLGTGHLALRLWVKGEKAVGLGPLLVVRMDGRMIGKTMLTAEGWTSLIIALDDEPGVRELSVEFTNDFYADGLGQDRNLTLGNLEIISLE